MNYVISGESSFVSRTLEKKLKKLHHRKVKHTFENADIFFHFVPNYQGEIDCQPFIENNLRQLFQMLELAKIFKRKFLLIGTRPLIGKPNRDACSLFHSFAEEVAEMFCEKYELSLAVIRFFEPFGPICDDPNSTIAKLELAKRNNQRFIHDGNEEEKKAYIHVDDIVNAVLSASKEKWQGQIFNLAMEKNYSVEKLLEIFKIDDFVFHPIFKLAISDPVMDTSFAQRNLKWTCLNSVESYAKNLLFEQKIKSFCNWIKRNILRTDSSFN